MCQYIWKHLGVLGQPKAFGPICRGIHRVPASIRVAVSAIPVRLATPGPEAVYTRIYPYRGCSLYSGGLSDLRKPISLNKQQRNPGGALRVAVGSLPFALVSSPEVRPFRRHCGSPRLTVQSSLTPTGQCFVRNSFVSVHKRNWHSARSNGRCCWPLRRQGVMDVRRSFPH